MPYTISTKLEDIKLIILRCLQHREKEFRDRENEGNKGYSFKIFDYQDYNNAHEACTTAGLDVYFNQVFNASKYFFVSTQIAKDYPDLPCSKMIFREFQTIFPRHSFRTLHQYRDFCQLDSGEKSPYNGWCSSLLATPIYCICSFSSLFQSAASEALSVSVCFGILFGLFAVYKAEPVYVIPACIALLTIMVFIIYWYDDHNKIFMTKVQKIFNTPAAMEDFVEPNTMMTDIENKEDTFVAAYDSQDNKHLYLSGENDLDVDGNESYTDEMDLHNIVAQHNNKSGIAYHAYSSADNTCNYAIKSTMNNFTGRDYSATRYYSSGQIESSRGPSIPDQFINIDKSDEYYKKPVFKKLANKVKLANKFSGKNDQRDPNVGLNEDVQEDAVRYDVSFNTDDRKPSFKKLAGKVRAINKFNPVQDEITYSRGSKVQAYTEKVMNLVQETENSTSSIEKNSSPSKKASLLLLASSSESPGEVAWSILHDSSKIMSDSLQDHLFEIGIVESDDLAHLDKEEATKIGRMLKPIPRKIFLKNLELLNQEN